MPTPSTPTLVGLDTGAPGGSAVRPRGRPPRAGQGARVRALPGRPAGSAPGMPPSPCKEDGPGWRTWASAEGTFVNGHPLRGSHELRPGDVVTFAVIRMRYELAPAVAVRSTVSAIRTAGRSTTSAATSTTTTSTSSSNATACCAMSRRRRPGPMVDRVRGGGRPRRVHGLRGRRARLHDRGRRCRHERQPVAAIDQSVRPPGVRHPLRPDRVGLRRDRLGDGDSRHRLPRRGHGAAPPGGSRDAADAALVPLDPPPHRQEEP